MGRHLGPRGFAFRKRWNRDVNKERRAEQKAKRDEQRAQPPTVLGLPVQGLLLLQGLLLHGAPVVLVQLVWAMFSARGPDIFDETLDFVEYFSGLEAVTRAMQANGLVAIGFELKKNRRYMNIMTGVGFLCAIEYALHLKSGMGGLLAPVCSSWVGFLLWKPFFAHKCHDRLGGRNNHVVPFLCCPYARDHDSCPLCCL